MATTIKLKNSVTTTNTPSSLAQGEVAINITDKKVWVGNAATTPIQLLGDGGSATFSSITVTGVSTFSAGTVSAPSITTTGDTNTGIYFPAADTIAFTEGGVESMRITSAGDVGIGTTSPATKLEIVGTTRVSSGTSTLNLGINAGIPYIQGFDGTTGANNQLTFYTSSSERMRIDVSGNVGIGNTPAGKLDVGSTSSSFVDSIIRASTTGTSELRFADTTINAGYITYDHTGDSMRFGTATTERMRITSAGVALVGKTATGLTTQGIQLVPSGSSAFTGPSGSVPLYINNIGTSSQSLIEFRTGTAGTTVPGSITTDGTNLAINGYTNLIFGTNSTTERMRLDSSGNLGLGVTPSAWAGNSKIITVSNAVVGRRNNGASILGHNFYESAVNTFTYTQTGVATRIEYPTSGGITFNTAPSGTAGNAITFTQAMTLDASGNLGIGTSSPATKLQVAGTGSQEFRVTTNTSGDIRLGMDLSGAYYNWIESYRANGSMVFATNNTERMRITSGGDLCIGKTTTSATTVGIVAEAIGSASFTRSETTNGDVTLYVYSTGASAARFYVGMAGTVYATSTTITAISDQRLKENIQDIDVGLDAVMALKPRKFDWKTGKGKDKKGDRGWIAQEFEQVFPEMIDTWKDPAPEGEEPYKAVNADLIPVLVKAIQELNAKVEAQAAEIALLKSK
jgi:hypothetical protein